jgi:purine-binding chemotaxis protein CheW
MVEDGAARTEADRRRFLTFKVDERLYALPAAEVLEVIRTPVVARLPHAPKSLSGLANLRGTVLPVASARGLLGKSETAAGGERSIVLDGDAPVALTVDSIEGLVSVDASCIDAEQGELASEAGERLTGAFQIAGRPDVAKVLDVRSLLTAAFAQRAAPDRRAEGVAALDRRGGEGAIEVRQRLVSFDVAGQSFALALEDVREVIAAPDTAVAAPLSESVVLGVAGYRDGLLPLLSLRTLLGLGGASGADGRAKVVVTAVGGALVGLVVDRMQAIVSADPAHIETTPPLLAARIGGEARVASIYRGEGGRRLVSILAPEHLFRGDVMRRLGERSDGAAPQQASDAAEEAQLQFLVFRIGDDEFGLPIEAVIEVANVPAKVTRVPKTPKFLEGVINLRGEVLPVIDQRRRFGMPALEGADRRRLIVLRTDRHRAGLIVDSVSEVLRRPATDIAEAPELAGEDNRLVYGVVNLETDGRIVMLLDPAELLTRAEQGLLDAFSPQADGE